MTTPAKRRQPLNNNTLVKLSPMDVRRLKDWMNNPLLPYFHYDCPLPNGGMLRVQFEAPAAVSDEKVQ